MNDETLHKEHFPSLQVPLAKGAITAPIVREKSKQSGQIKYVKEEDHFKVIYATKGVVIENLNTEIRITDVVDSHLAVGKFVGPGLAVKEGYKVQKVSKE